MVLDVAVWSHGGAAPRMTPEAVFRGGDPEGGGVGEELPGQQQLVVHDVEIQVLFILW